MITEASFTVKESSLKACHEYVRKKFQKMDCEDILLDPDRMINVDEIGLCLACKDRK